MEHRWIRVSKEFPCPVCEKDTWCGFSVDKKVVICMRTPSSKPAKNGGHVHYLEDKHKWQIKRFVPKPKIRPPATDFFELMNKYKLQCTDSICRQLSQKLGVSEDSLRRLEIGYDGAGCYSFPMRNSDDKVVGLKLRAANGSKYCVPGSNLGIYAPIDVSSAARELLVIAEGESDTAALLSMGFQAIGRPSCTAGVEIIQAFLSKGWRDVIIMADNDEPKERPDGSVWRPGLDGANALAAAIARLTRSTKVIKPPSYKDVRQWYRAGATKAAIEVLAKHTRPWSKQ